MSNVPFAYRFGIPDSSSLARIADSSNLAGIAGVEEVGYYGCLWSAGAPIAPVNSFDLEEWRDKERRELVFLRLVPRAGSDPAPPSKPKRDPFKRTSLEEFRARYGGH